MPSRPAIAFICSLEGVVLEVLLDQIGLGARLAAGKPFAAIAEAESVGIFLHRARDADSIVQQEIRTSQPAGAAPLFFHAHVIARGIVVFASAKPLSRTAVLRRLHSLLRRPAGAKRRSSVRSVAVVAHDLRNPIAGILAASQYLLGERDALPNEEHVRLLEAIQTSSRLLLRLVDEILEPLGREAEGTETDFRPTDILALAERNLAMNRLLAARKGIHLNLAAEEPRLEITADPSRVGLVIDNLIANAIKFSPAGGTIHVRLGRRHEMALISVQDEGSGIPSADIPKMFEPFTQLGKRASPPQPGIGLGLAIVKRIVESHGGHVEVASEVGRGSTFTVLLPIRAGHTQASGPVSG